MKFSIVGLGLVLAIAVSGCTQRLYVPDGLAVETSEATINQTCGDDSCTGVSADPQEASDEPSELPSEPPPDEPEDGSIDPLIVSEAEISTGEPTSNPGPAPAPETNENYEPEPETAVNSPAEKTEEIQVEPVPSGFQIAITAPETVSAGSTLKFEIEISNFEGRSRPVGSSIKATYTGPGFQIDSSAADCGSVFYVRPAGERTVDTCVFRVLLGSQDSGVAKLEAAFRLVAEDPTTEVSTVREVTIR